MHYRPLVEISTSICVNTISIQLQKFIHNSNRESSCMSYNCICISIRVYTWAENNKMLELYYVQWRWSTFVNLPVKTRMTTCIINLLKSQLETIHILYTLTGIVRKLVVVTSAIVTSEVGAYNLLYKYNNIRV